MTWPNFFKEGCPPDNASADTLTVYRLVENVPPKEEDFKSHKERWPRKDYSADECGACAVSVFTDMKQAVVASELISQRRKNSKMKLAKGQTNPNKGLVQRSLNSSHVNYWLYDGQTVHCEFKVIPGRTEGL